MKTEIFSKATAELQKEIEKDLQKEDRDLSEILNNEATRQRGPEGVSRSDGEDNGVDKEKV